jgi:UDP-N-acetyl-D-galactosamine dehydrogenase
LVGGHCIGVDPYYLTHKAEMLGYTPQVILAGRRINDSMGKYVAEQTVKQMIASDLQVKGGTVIVLGMTFKENCPDLRNSKVIDVVRELQSFGAKVLVHDPLADSAECEHEYGVSLTPWEALPQASAIVAAVSHRDYLTMGVPGLTQKLVKGGVFVDVKSCFDEAELASTGASIWRL